MESWSVSPAWSSSMAHSRYSGPGATRPQAHRGIRTITEVGLQNETPVSLWGRSHLGTTPHIPLTQFENQAYRSYVIQVFSSA